MRGLSSLVTRRAERIASAMRAEMLLQKFDVVSKAKKIGGGTLVACEMLQ